MKNTLQSPGNARRSCGAPVELFWPSPRGVAWPQGAHPRILGVLAAPHRMEINSKSSLNFSSRLTTGYIDQITSKKKKKAKYIGHWKGLIKGGKPEGWNQFTLTRNLGIASGALCHELSPWLRYQAKSGVSAVILHQYSDRTRSRKNKTKTRKTITYFLPDLGKGPYCSVLWEGLMASFDFNQKTFILSQLENAGD